MIVEERDYEIRPGQLQVYVDSYAAEGLAIQQPILGRLIGYFTTDLGELNRVVHIWGYDDAADRERRRIALGANEQWRAYVHKMLPMIVQMRSRLLVPTPFSPIR